jgi:hypothetical protein
MNKEAYELGVQLALQDAGLVKTAGAGTALLRKAIGDTGTMYRAMPAMSQYGIAGLGGAGIGGLVDGEEGALTGLLAGLGARGLGGLGASARAKVLSRLEKNMGQHANTHLGRFLMPGGRVGAAAGGAAGLGTGLALQDSE